MAAARRSSLQDNPGTKLGEPFQIYTEVVNAGKTVQGTKKKVRWLFGFANSDQEYEVTLVISILSGKKVICEDGKEIVNVTSMMNTDFAHGWSSLQTRRLYRVEANLNISGDLSFVFSVDGVAYIDFPEKHAVKRSSGMGGSVSSGSGGGGRYGDEVLETTHHARRASTGSIPATSKPSPVNRTAPSKPATLTTKLSDTFDPFADGGAADPFAEPASSSSASSTTKSTPVAASTAGKSPAARTSVSSNAKTPPAAATKSVEKKSSAASLFDEVPAAQSSSFDPFSSSADPFAPTTTSSTHTTTASKPRISAAANTFDAFGDSPASSDPFQQSSAPSSTFASFGAFDADGFSTAPPVIAPTVAPAATAQSSQKPPARRSSAAEISNDLAGLTFGPPVAVTLPTKTVVATPDPAPVASTTASNPEAAKVEPKVVDPWQTNLVDLDLSGRSGAPARRASQQPGPSLDLLLGQQQTRRSINEPQSSASVLASLNDPFGAPPILQATAKPTPMTSAVPPRPVSAADAISSLGGPLHPQAAPMGLGGGYPPAGAPPRPFAPAAMNNTRASFTGAMPPVAPAGPGIMNGAAGRSSFIMPAPSSGASSLGQPQAPKTSLDTLDWRA